MKLLEQHTNSFNENGFTKIDPPILTAVFQKEQVNCSILSTLMKMHSFQSGQLYMEAAAMAHGRVFSFDQLSELKNLKLDAI